MEQTTHSTANESSSELSGEILPPSSPQKPGATILLFPSWLPYAIATGLMILGLAETGEIFVLQSRLAAMNVEITRLNQSNAHTGLRLALLDARNAAYVSAKVMVAWDPYEDRGILSLQNLPAPPPGHEYQLWVLDPTAPAPLSAGIITPEAGSRAFEAKPVNVSSPGFAISLEPGGGSPAPTTGSILLAVAPGQ